MERNAAEPRLLPFDLFLSRSEGVRLATPRAGCSRAAMVRAASRSDRHASLSVAESALDQRVILNDFGGATAEAEVAARGLTMADLFVPRSADEMRERDAVMFAVRQRHARDPKRVWREMLGRELERTRDRLERMHGFVPPLTARDLNEARERVARVLGVDLPEPLPQREWEGYPGQADPLWPFLFARGVAWAQNEAREQRVERIVSLRAVRFRAAVLAASWLRGIS